MKYIEGFTAEHRKRLTMEIIGYLLAHPDSWASDIVNNVDSDPDWEDSAVNSVLYSNTGSGLFRYKSPDDRRWFMPKPFIQSAQSGGGHWDAPDGIHAGARVYPWNVPDDDSTVAPVAPDSQVSQVQLEFRRLGFEVLPNNYETVQHATERASGWARRYGTPLSHFEVNRMAVIDVLAQHFHREKIVIYGPTEDLGQTGAEAFERKARYFVLQIDRPGYRAAVAVSPVNSHGVYVTRSDAVNRDWTSVLSGARVAARVAGARTLSFTDSHPELGSVDALALRVIAFLECSAQDFANRDKGLQYKSNVQQYVMR